MSQRQGASPSLIGAFILGALLLGVAAVFLLSDRGFSAGAEKFVLYFESDIKGLQVGAPVNFRGVKIGQVESMRIIYEEGSQEFQIPVVISIRKDTVEFDGALGKGIDIEQMVGRGLRARLNLQSLVTGKLEVELDFYPEEPPREIHAGNDYPEIPTVQSGLEKLASALEEFPLEKITRRVSEILDILDESVAEGQFPKMISNIVLLSERLEKISQVLEQETPLLLGDSRETLREIRTLTRELTLAAGEARTLIANGGQQLDGAFRRWDSTLASGEAAFEEVRQVAASADEQLDPGSPLIGEMTRAIRELGAAAHSIRIMSDYLERHPEALLRGKGQ